MDAIQSRVLPTDNSTSLAETQHKHCANCYDIYSFQRLPDGSHKENCVANCGAPSDVVAAENDLLCEDCARSMYRYAQHNACLASQSDHEELSAERTADWMACAAPFT